MELILLSSVSTRKHSAQGVAEYSQQAGKDHAPSGKINYFIPVVINMFGLLDF